MKATSAEISPGWRSRLGICGNSKRGGSVAAGFARMRDRNSSWYLWGISCCAYWRDLFDEATVFVWQVMHPLATKSGRPPASRESHAPGAAGRASVHATTDKHDRGVAP